MRAADETKRKETVKDLTNISLSSILGRIHSQNQNSFSAITHWASIGWPCCRRRRSNYGGRPLARSPQIFHARAGKILIASSDCAQVLPLKSWATIRAHCSNNARLRSNFRPTSQSARAMQDGVRLALLHFL